MIGDVPYTDEAATNAFPNMIEEINAADLSFVVHDGDIKHGDSPCTDEVFRERFAQPQWAKLAPTSARVLKTENAWLIARRFHFLF